MGSDGGAFAVLIVEDQALIALSVEDTIKGFGGYTVGWAATLDEALTLVDMATWDAVLLDIRLAHGEPVFPVAERLQVKGIPFAFVTGWDGDIDARYSRVPVFRKPFGHEDLERCLRVLLPIVQPNGTPRAA